ncbi:YEATS domain-containing protein 4 isoform X5 [Canis lupus familiaris]|uniref:YEATS domain-containing protein 4 isoform X5 n=1 Tax=Canis lupus familiaris TaxID=9615 RepID=UPI000DC66C2D|nr:YEATS domain-containing protein 4 isoform X5 [Canis lupus familiaris]
MFKRMAEFGPDSGGRVKGVTIVKPIVYGNVARYFGKKREEDGHTHQWTVYVKPYRNEDMSAYVKKIQFKLHESYGNPLRVVTKPPYEITETGWGEFEIIIKIFFIDPNERPVTLYHLLKLFQSDTNAMLGKKTVVSEFYDEMIFQDPTAMMQQLLTTSRQLTLGAYKHETEYIERERMRQRHRQREKQAPCREPDAGLNPGTPGSRPGPKAGATPLSHPGIPCLLPF